MLAIRSKMKKLKKISVLGNRIIQNQAIKEQDTYSLNFFMSLIKKLSFNNLTISFFYIRDKSGHTPAFNENFFTKKKPQEVTGFPEKFVDKNSAQKSLAKRDTLFENKNFTADSFYEIETKFNTNINGSLPRKESKEDQSYGLNEING